MEVTKIDNENIEVTKTEEVVEQHNIIFLIEQKKRIQERADKEIAEIDVLLAGAKKQGIDVVAIGLKSDQAISA